MNLPPELTQYLQNLMIAEECFDYTLFSMDKLIITPKVRLKCMYGCQNYGIQRKCPPNDTLSPVQCIKYLKDYSNALLIRFVPDQDFGAPINAQSILLEIERKAMLNNLRFALAVFPTHCHQCDLCHISQECAKPLQARPSISSLCIDILGTLEKLGLQQKILTSKDQPKEFYYLGLILLE
ncbi:hypothetical protein NEF87_000948 [Candidatus Lokiarchaeum ossiferum]|uniref:DUF2284 domain-containing protein n=1 Tax=Candidatus Lokiarchaeum ossiferum TaxID=2951803 RepID=A0ABY6HMC0_9ARCH|nr:hypothetical protein NEF87_000948 [Candidatus Lokiarchaeum sp. B-35]